MTSRYIGTHLTWFLGRGALIQGSHYSWRQPDDKGVWHDEGAEENHEGPFASGLPWDTPGIALPDHSILRQWCRVSMPRQSIVAVVRCVDIGPRHPVLDLTAPLAHLLFTSLANFPDYTPWTVDVLGPELPEGVTASVTNLRTGSVTPVPDTL